MSAVSSLWSFFFFQAEDGIRDDLVTGVQTCALPIFIFSIRKTTPFSRPSLLSFLWSRTPVLNFADWIPLEFSLPVPHDKTAPIVQFPATGTPPGAHHFRLVEGWALLLFVFSTSDEAFCVCNS